MLFNSFHFLLFFPIVTGIYYLLPGKYRMLWILLASCYFYLAFIPIYILILFLAIIIDYAAGIMIDAAKKEVTRRRWLIFSILSTCLILFFFKYYNFAIENINWLLSLSGAKELGALNIILPIGLSFHTFQSLSYVIEVYRKKQSSERNLLLYSVYVMYYPQLVAGPIERPQNLLHQFREPHPFSYENILAGGKLMLWGLFKKVVLADHLSEYVNKSYSNLHDVEGPTLLVSALMFSMQIYFDFSGYSDIALGSSKTLGIDLMQNFNRPYFSKSITEFWRRWHISLSTWFKDYVYVPLGGSKQGKMKHIRNLAITFLVSGLWHGASWNFVIWGGLHAIFLIAELLLKQANKLNFSFLRTVFTFSLVTFGWVFFRARTLGDAGYILDNIFSIDTFTHFDKTKVMYGFDIAYFFILITALAIWFVVEWSQRNSEASDLLSGKPLLVRYTFYFSLILMLFLFGSYHNQSEFIYFQF